MDLLPWSALIRVSKHMENAIAPDPETNEPHYPERNWEKGLPMHSMIDSAFRHLAKYMQGMADEDHLCAAATNLLMAMWMEENKPEMQDIPSRTKGTEFGFTIQAGKIDLSMLCEYPEVVRRCTYFKNGTCIHGHEETECQYKACLTYLHELKGKKTASTPNKCKYYDSGYCTGTKEKDPCKETQCAHYVVDYSDVHDIVDE